MKVFAVQYGYVAETAEARGQLIDQHRGWLDAIDAEQRLLGAGVLPDGTGALLLFEAESRDAIAADLSRDPFATNGLIAKTHVDEWNPVRGLIERARSARTSG